MLIIKVGKNEKIDRALKRFKNKTKKIGLIKELRSNKFYEKPSSKRRNVIDKAKYIQKLKNNE